MCWISLQPVPNAIQSGYGKTNSTIAFIGLIFVIVFIPVNFPANFVIDKGGLKLGVSISDFLLTVYFLGSFRHVFGYDRHVGKSLDQRKLLLCFYWPDFSSGRLAFNSSSSSETCRFLVRPRWASNRRDHRHSSSANRRSNWLPFPFYFRETWRYEWPRGGKNTYFPVAFLPSYYWNRCYDCLSNLVQRETTKSTK